MANQRAMLRDYASLHDDLADSMVMELCDDGYSGTNFERPVVKKLLELTKERRVHYIIAKDFSRFGREHIAVSDYVDQIFPFLGIRFISVNDGYDSKQCFGMTGGFDINLRNVMSVRKVTLLLNGDKTPTPSQLQNRKGFYHKWWIGLGGERIWDEGKVCAILRDGRYLGTAVFVTPSDDGISGCNTKNGMNSTV